MIDYRTRRDIDKAIEAVLKEADLRTPPILIEPLLKHLEVHRGFYDLQDPNLLQRFWHKVKVRKQKLIDIISQINLSAVWLPDQERILVDASLPPVKQEWASFHDATHKILVWHRAYFLGDTAQTLNPDFQEMLEAEANYGASALMFCGKVFTKEALDTIPRWGSIDLLKKRYCKSYVTTLRRYVQFSHDEPMALMVSTPWWEEKPENQEKYWRHFVRSDRFITEFGEISAEKLLSEINNNTKKRKGGPVGEFTFPLLDINGIRHEFHCGSFFNQHYVLTFITYIKPITKKIITL